MGLHRLTTVTIGVPDVDATVAFYKEFGLTSVGPGRLGTADGGPQLELVKTPRRRLVESGLGVDDPDDVERIARATGAVNEDGRVEVTEPASEVKVFVAVADRITPQETTSAVFNDPSHDARPDQRAPAIERTGAVHPRKLGHVVIGSPDAAATQAFFLNLGFKVSDEVKGLAAFLGCSTDHHNLLVQRRPPPPPSFLRPDDLAELMAR